MDFRKHKNGKAYPITPGRGRRGSSSGKDRVSRGSASDPTSEYLKGLRDRADNDKVGVWVPSYAVAEANGIPRIEDSYIVNAVIDPETGKAVAYGEGQSFRHWGKQTDVNNMKEYVLEFENGESVKINATNEANARLFAEKQYNLTGKEQLLRRETKVTRVPKKKGPKTEMRYENGHYVEYRDGKRIGWAKTIEPDNAQHKDFHVESKGNVSDGFEAANESLRIAERQLGTPRNAETGEYEFYDEGTGRTVSDNDLDKRKFTGFSITVPNSKGELFQVSGTIIKGDRGFHSGAEVSPIDVE